MTNIDLGLTPTDFDLRQKQFGDNQKAPAKMTPYYKLLLGALDDFMLKFLLVCAVVDLVIEVAFATPEERPTCKCWCLSNHNNNYTIYELVPIK